MSDVHVVVPAGIDDPLRPSGGNVYDRQVCAGLIRLGWSVHEHAVAGDWPRPDAGASTALEALLAGIPDHAVVLVDGLVACAVPSVLAAVADRLRLVVLVHMPLGQLGAEEASRERAALTSAAGVVTTSRWCRHWLMEHYDVAGGRVRVAEPGVVRAHPTYGTRHGGELLCVAAVTPGKGHDVLLAALASLDDLSWRCTCVGSLDLAPDLAQSLVRRAAGLGDRVRFTGALTGTDLDAAYAGSDLLISASRTESFGMVVTEALARGLPVVATGVGGVAEALGRGADGSRPGTLVAAEDPAALAAALRRWLTDPHERERLREAAQLRRMTLPGWDHPTRRIARVLDDLLTSRPAR